MEDVKLCETQTSEENPRRHRTDYMGRSAEMSDILYPSALTRRWHPSPLDESVYPIEAITTVGQPPQPRAMPIPIGC
jgi:hypothetical protein